MLPISLVRNKRKSSEPSKVISERAEELTMASQSNGPLKKRIRYSSSADSGVVLTPPSVQLSSAATPPPTAAAASLAQTQNASAASSPASSVWDSSHSIPHELMPNPAQVFLRHPGVTTLHRLPLEHIAHHHLNVASALEEQLEPLALVLKKPEATESSSETLNLKKTPSKLCAKSVTPKKRATVREASLEKSPKFAKSSHNHRPAAAATTTFVPVPCASSSHSVTSSSPEESLLNTSLNLKTNNCSASSSFSGNSAGKTQQRNYKNMTRERRIEANARERSRVHTISAAYETLRKAVPSYSNNQKLSKLSVLRVACSYILTLSRMAGEDYSEDQSQPSLASCFDAVTATIQTEGKIRKKKEDEEKEK